MRQPPGLKAGCLFNGLALQVFAAVRQIRPPTRIVDVVHCRRQRLQPHLFHASKQPAAVVYAAAAAMVVDMRIPKVQVCCISLAKRGYMGGNRKHPSIHPQTNGSGKCVSYSLYCVIYMV